MLTTLATLGVMALSTYYLRDQLFGELPPPPKRKVRSTEQRQNAFNSASAFYGKDIQVRWAKKDTVLCKFNNILTVSYDMKYRTFQVGEIERPKSVEFFASDILAYVIFEIAKFLKKNLSKQELDNDKELAGYLERNSLPISKIHGGAIVNTATQLLTNFPGAELMSKWMGRVSVLPALTTPLGKMVSHFLDEHYPERTMKSVMLEKGPRTNAKNAVIELEDRE